MLRPPSILLFERLYLGSLVLWAANTAVFWSRTQEIAAANPQMQANPQVAAVIAPIMIGSVAVTGLVSLLFWWLVARQGSLVGKWLVVVTEAIGTLGAVLGLLRLVQGRTPSVPMSIAQLAITAMAVAAAVVLFRPDAKEWLGEGEENEAVPPAQPLA